MTLAALNGRTFKVINGLIELTTITNQKVTANKNDIYNANDKIISYYGDMHELKGPTILLDQLIAEPNKYLIRPFLSMPGYFFVLIEVENT